MSFFRRFSSGTSTILIPEDSSISSPVGVFSSAGGSSSASVGAGNVRVMIWMIRTPAENVSSL